MEASKTLITKMTGAMRRVSLSQYQGLVLISVADTSLCDDTFGLLQTLNTPEALPNGSVLFPQTQLY